MDNKIEEITYLIQQSPLDQTIKDILIRDLNSDGLTEFLREQIKAYCMDGIKNIDSRIEAAQKYLQEHNEQTPAA